MIKLTRHEWTIDMARRYQERLKGRLKIFEVQICQIFQSRFSSVWMYIQENEEGGCVLLLYIHIRMLLEIVFIMA